MGRVSFGYTTTTATGTGSTSATGYYDLSGSDQVIFSKSTETPTYSPNTYRVLARTGTSAAQVIFTIQFRDDSANPNPTSYGPYGVFGVDEDVDGTLTSTVQVYRASGVNVSVALPPATSSGI